MYGKEVYEMISKLAADFKKPAVEFLQKLIQIPSESGEEGPLVDLILSELEKVGFDEYFRDGIGNVIGIIKGEPGGPTIMYNTHLDVVGIGDRKNWQGYDPLGGEIDVCEVDNWDASVKEMAECVHGRGASDVKAGHAQQIYIGAILLKLREMGYKFKGTYMYTGVVLEEPGSAVGMSYLIDNTLPERGLTYDAVVSSEATSLKLVLGHKGKTELLATVYGRTSHGSAPWRGINAIYKAIPLIKKINEELYPELISRKDKELGSASISLNIIECSPGALSVVPDRCMLALDRRCLLGETSQQAVEEIQAIIDELAAKDPEFKAEVMINRSIQKSYTGVETDITKESFPWKLPVDHPFTVACANALESVGQEVRYGYWDFGTDLSRTAALDRKPSIGYSPMQEQYAHTPYDKVRVDYLEKSIAGGTSIFLHAIECPKDSFTF